LFCCCNCTALNCTAPSLHYTALWAGLVKGKAARRAESGHDEWKLEAGEREMVTEKRQRLRDQRSAALSLAWFDAGYRNLLRISLNRWRPETEVKCGLNLNRAFRFLFWWVPFAMTAFFGRANIMACLPSQPPCIL